MKKINKKIALVFAIVLVGTATGYFFLRGENKTTADTEVRPVNTVDYSGPTAEEAAAGDEQKKKNEEREKIENGNYTPPKIADIVVVDASQYGAIIEVRAYIRNLYESGGTCTASFSRGGQTVSKSSPASKDATTTQCATISIPRSEFASGGDWQFSLNYSSSSASGKTNPKSVNIK